MSVRWCSLCNYTFPMDMFGSRKTSGIIFSTHEVPHGYVSAWHINHKHHSTCFL